jgi:hypothetical protein
MKISLKKKIAAAAAAATIAGGAGIAFAYWTTTGSGTGSATAGTSSALTINGSTTGNLYPGTSVPVSFTADNPSPGVQYVTSISLASVTASNPACVVADFTMPTVPVGEEVASGLAQPITATGTLTMANTADNQDACKNATLTLGFTSN